MNELRTLFVYDDVIKNIDAMRLDALTSDFYDYEAHDGEVYKRVVIKELPDLDEIVRLIMGSDIDMLMSGYRLNYDGEVPNNYVHSDLGFGQYACVLYLCDGYGGTGFWRHKETGATRIDVGDVELFEKVRHDWNNENAWELEEVVQLKYNRIVVYESASFHSRYPSEAFGQLPENGRLIAVGFFNLKENH